MQQGQADGSLCPSLYIVSSALSYSFNTERCEKVPIEATVQQYKGKWPFDENRRISKNCHSERSAAESSNLFALPLEQDSSTALRSGCGRSARNDTSAFLHQLSICTWYHWSWAVPTGRSRGKEGSASLILRNSHGARKVTHHAMEA